MEIKKEIENIKREWIEGDSDYTTLCLTKGYSLGIKEAAEIATDLWLEQRLIPGAEYPVNIYSESVQEKILKLLDEPNFKKEE